MREKWSIYGSTLVVCICAAQNVDAQSATAEALFQEGKTLMKSAQYDKACPKLEESYRQDPATGALLALAMCHEKQGKLATAWAEFLDVASRSKQEGRKDRAEAARKSADGLQPKLSQLTLQVSEETSKIDGLEIRGDGAVVGRAAWGTATPVDAGQHRINVSAPGRETWSTVVNVGANDSRTVTIPTLKSAAPTAKSEAPAPIANIPRPPEPAAPVQKKRGMAPLRVAGLVAGGVGVVGVGLGTYFGLSAISGKKDTDGACPAQGCTNADAFNKREDATKAGNFATVAFIAGGALVATGATLFIIGGPKKSTEVGVAQTNLTPMFGPHDASVMLSGAF